MLLPDLTGPEHYRCAQQMWKATTMHRKQFGTVFDQVIEALYDDFEVLVSEMEELTGECRDRSYIKKKRSVIKTLRKRMELLEELYSEESDNESSSTLVEG